MSRFDAIPERFKDRRRWLLWDGSNETPRRPHWRGDFLGISWNEPDDWHTFEDAVEAAQEHESWGIGYVFQSGDDEYMIDVDRPFDEAGEPRDWFPGLEQFIDDGAYMEWSPSENGVHIPVEGEPPAWWRDSDVNGADHQGVDVLENKFCTFTGNVLHEAGDSVTDINAAPFLFSAYRAIRGESPFDADDAEEGGFECDGELTKEQVTDALEHVDPNLHFNDWLRVGFAVYDWDSGSTGKRIFEKWSASNSKWDASRGQHHIDDIWDNDSANGQVTVATLVYHAKEGGWDPPSLSPADSGSSADGPASKSGGETPSWDQVATLFDSDANGTTTKAYNIAAELVDETHDFVTVRESGELYHYKPDRGYYVRKGETYLEEILNDKLAEHANSRRRREIGDKVKGENRIASDDFHPPEGKVNVENGVLDLDTRDLEPHSSDYYFTSQVRAEWPADGEPDHDAAEIWTGALADVTDDPRERKKIEEFIGYTLETWHHDREKNLLLVGPRLSGKSTIQEAIEALFGTAPTVSALTPQQITRNRFDAAALREAALNSTNDINARKIEDTGTLKKVFSGERMKIENKYKDAHFAAPKAKHLFTANWLPRLVGQDDAVYRRVLLIEFTNTIEDHEKDPEYKKRLQRDDVQQAILKRAVDARERLHAQGGFTNDRSPNDTRQLWDSWRDGHKRFLYTQFEITGDPDDTAGREAYWQAYREFATRKGFELKSNVAITKSLQYVPEVYASGDADTYGGLTWRDHDAATADVTLDGDPPPAADEGRQTSLNTQEQRHEQVRSVVRDLAADGDGAADREAIVEAAAEAGMSSDQAEHVLEKLLREGRLMEPQTGEVRPT